MQEISSMNSRHSLTKRRSRVILHIQQQIQLGTYTGMHFHCKDKSRKTCTEIQGNCHIIYLAILVCILSLALGCHNRMKSIDNAVIGGDVANVRSLLVADPALINAMDNYGFTPLMVAAQIGHPDVVELLLERGAAIEAKDNKEFTALIYAASEGHPDVVKLLLERGAAVNARNYQGATSLSFAASKGHVDVVMLLLEKGAEVDAKDNVGRTPLMLAALNGHVDVVVRLLAKDAVVDTKDNSGFTARQFAEHGGHQVIADLLQ